MLVSVRRLTPRAAGQRNDAMGQLIPAPSRVRSAVNGRLGRDRPRCLRRTAHEAMLASRSTELLVLARLALQAAIRDRFLDSAPSRAPAKAAPVEGLEPAQ